MRFHCDIPLMKHSVYDVCEKSIVLGKLLSGCSARVSVSYAYSASVLGESYCCRQPTSPHYFVLNMRDPLIRNLTNGIRRPRRTPSLDAATCV